METDVAVIEGYYDGEWEPMFFIGPDRSAGVIDPEEFAHYSNIRVRYLRQQSKSTNEDILDE